MKFLNLTPIMAVFCVLSAVSSSANPEPLKEPRFSELPRDVLCKIFDQLPFESLPAVGGVCRRWHWAKMKFNQDHMDCFKKLFPQAFELYTEEELGQVLNWKKELHLHFEAQEYIEKHVRDFGTMEATNNNGRTLPKEVLGFYGRELSRLRLPIVRLSVAMGAWSGLDANGFSPLHYAFDNPEYIALLLKNKSLDVDLRNPDGCTALHIACWSREFKTVELLINAGADVNALSGDGFPLEDALSGENWDGDETNLNLFKIVDLLLEKGGRTHDHPILHYANDDTLDILLRKIPSLDVNQKDSYGGTALHHWFTRDFGIDNLRTMIKNGADVTMQDHGGDTPLLVLVHHLEKDHWWTDSALNSAQLLIESGPLCVNMKNKKGNTPLHYLSHPDAGMTALLLAYGADINAKNIKGETPLDRQGARHGILEDLRHENQITALLMAAEHSPNNSPEEKKERIKKLLEIEDLFEAHVPVKNGNSIDYLSINKANFALWIALISKQPLDVIEKMVVQNGVFCDPIAFKLARRFHSEAEALMEECFNGNLDFLERVPTPSFREERNEFGKRPRIQGGEIERDELRIVAIRDNPQATLEEIEQRIDEIMQPQDLDVPEPMDIDDPYGLHDNNAEDEVAELLRGDIPTRNSLFGQWS